MPSVNAIFNEIYQEFERAESKHPDWPADIYRQLAIVTEEAGEVAKAVLHLEYENGTLLEVRQELIQTAAMCFRMIINMPEKEELVENNQCQHSDTIWVKQIAERYCPRCRSIV